MATIRVPEMVFSGFKIIGELSGSELDKLIIYLNNLELGKFYGDLAEDLYDLLNIDGDDLLKAILSFTGLVSEEQDSYSVLAKNLAESYKELSNTKLNTKDTNKLKSNLLDILSNMDRIQLAEKAREFSVENSNNLREFKFITDIRLLENESSTNNENYGIVLHKLYLEYQNSDPLNELHLSISLEDLIELKNQIEKAIERDKRLRETYSGNIKLI
ncbi:hypothetical protein [Zobellia roscoffensis]|uniref:hypothetical protein n=1 Tax=Zobellia roscoffensis TaxID=2779508 RepID=UPI00188A5639|nr:hypothetical protein [Zobellia roscoffensis]